MKQHQVDVCVVGGGPAGMLLGLLLSSKGVKTLVLEKHRDFAREYRGEVLMPRFTQMFRQIGLDQWLMGITHLKLKEGQIFFRDRLVGKLNFSTFVPDVPYALWMPQPKLLGALAEKAKQYPSFELWFSADAKQKIDGRSLPTIQVKHEAEMGEVSARVIVGADGRFSTLMKQLDVEIEYQDHSFDVLWFSIPKPEGYENTFKVLLSMKRSYLLLPKYPDEIQVGLLVQPGELTQIRKAGLEKIKSELKKASPIFHGFADSMKDFTVFHPLQAHLHLVKKWAREGYLLIGDSAHCFSPAGAIGVSMAVGTAIVAADVIREGLKTELGALSEKTLSLIQEIREPDVRRIHKLQMRLTGNRLARFLPIRWVLPVIITTLARTPIFRRFQRQLMSIPPLPISADWKFS